MSDKEAKLRITVDKIIAVLWSALIELTHHNSLRPLQCKHVVLVGADEQEHVQKEDDCVGHPDSELMGHPELDEAPNCSEEGQSADQRTGREEQELGRVHGKLVGYGVHFCKMAGGESVL